jgi:hypothetical protein
VEKEIQYYKLIKWLRSDRHDEALTYNIETYKKAWTNIKISKKWLESKTKKTAKKTKKKDKNLWKYVKTVKKICKNM